MWLPSKNVSDQDQVNQNQQIIQGFLKTELLVIQTA